MADNDIMRETHRCFICDGKNLKITELAFGGGGKRARFSCPDCQSKGELTNMEPFRGRELPFETLCGIFAIAGIEILGTRKLPNGYNGPGDYHPWWFVKTAKGWIEIGWRKRVIAIDWSDTGLLATVTQDEVTKGDLYVHAYSEAKAAEYLKVLGELITLYAPKEAV